MILTRIGRRCASRRHQGSLGHRWCRFNANKACRRFSRPRPASPFTVGFSIRRAVGAAAPRVSGHRRSLPELHVVPLWDTAETAIDGIVLRQSRASPAGPPDVFLKIRDAITTDRFEIDLAPVGCAGLQPATPVSRRALPIPSNRRKSSCPGNRRGCRPWAASTAASLPMFTTSPRTLVRPPAPADAVRRPSPPRGSPPRPDDSKFSRGRSCCAGWHEPAFPTAFPGRLTKKAGFYTYTEDMTETAIAILERASPPPASIR